MKPERTAKTVKSALLVSRQRSLRLFLLLLLPCLAWLVSCKTAGQPAGATLDNDIRKDGLHTGAPASEPAPPPSGYILGTDDVIHILVYGEPDLTTVARVSRDGTVEMPLIGKLPASGLNQEELARSIKERLEAGYLVQPDVRIVLQEFRQNMVYLMGQVAVPGPYRITHGNTLMEIISKAGGFTPIAKRKKVKIIRSGRDRSRVFYMDASRITDEGRLEEDVVLMPGDMIIVPERFF